jgi:mannose-6-phosphate isomerase
MNRRPFPLAVSFCEKIWGAADLEPWFRPRAANTGEVWFTMPGAEPLPILVKFIFTSDRLSVQVHPDDVYAQAHEGCGGKTEMWYVLRAGPGARLAAGFERTITPDRLREAALSGEIEHLLRWFPVQAGQVYCIPPGTVHALGAGIVVCEIQQNNPITYRLYDYGRPRELHLTKAMAVASGETHPGPAVPEGNLLASCRYFRTERLEVTRLRYQPDAADFHLLVFLEGSGLIDDRQFQPGETWYVPGGAAPFEINAESRAVLLRTSVPR